jgi:hypothetical protein
VQFMGKGLGMKWLLKKWWSTNFTLLQEGDRCHCHWHNTVEIDGKFV